MAGGGGSEEEGHSASEAASIVFRIVTVGLSLASAITTAASTQCVRGDDGRVAATDSYSDYHSFRYAAAADLVSAVLQGVAIYLEAVRKEEAARVVELIDKLVQALTSSSGRAAARRRRHHLLRASRAPPAAAAGNGGKAAASAASPAGSAARHAAKRAAAVTPPPTTKKKKPQSSRRPPSRETSTGTTRVPFAAEGSSAHAAAAAAAAADEAAAAVRGVPEADDPVQLREPRAVLRLLLEYSRSYTTPRRRMPAMEALCITAKLPTASFFF
ncbi:hypothetical protein OsJ_36368 [Oryza sativa Japonica Group]|uniref:CASP-like protein n=1 Tax=Oryza sativa subsp. japonica TaxID=39947 RepID=B9GDJ1_ORYSJ|nr:hypothetical protein OsJ_36368 [Oryza sativa Japonica Group]